MPSPGEEAVLALCATAQQLIEALQAGATEASVSALQVEYEQRWAAVRAAAEDVDRRRAAAATGHGGVAGAQQSQSSSGGERAELAALQTERLRLQGALAARNGELKEQIDLLRELLCSAQLSGVLFD